MTQIQHNHTETGRRGDCPACQLRLPSVENATAPPGCTYEFEDNPIDGDYICRRHGFIAKDVSLYEKFQEVSNLPIDDAHLAVAEFFKTYTGRCLAIIKEIS